MIIVYLNKKGYNSKFNHYIVSIMLIAAVYLIGAFYKNIDIIIEITVNINLK